ncbi:DUF1549 domain-containing protein [Pseudenhygromyxa sp. WMMC2535]|uniref:DUF1549 domain-containing protein n=1 Tax=Pseudenhygromyxa sp. WMMC2535 TaxID=2712867 RepID=UPI001595E8D8|nr:DUF1549 domain-containing protein [Pseudenhygromyxa sp. WMMC2535]NVB39402.1 DUF1549 domain-containing protein [Pseudenhygromyxa sp. WMMC2535]
MAASPHRINIVAAGLSLLVLAGTSACLDVEGMDPANPARGPGELVGNGAPITDGNFPGGYDEAPEARDVTAPTDKPIVCDVACQSYCDGLGLTNPVNVGVCSSMWGVGIASQPIDRRQACRKLYADFVGRYPTPSEVNEVCDHEDWGETVKTLMATDEFVLVQQRRWADLMLYNNRTVNVERIYDMDDLVRKVYQGYVSWDLFASVAASHPVLTRRYDTAGDRAEAAFKLFLHRPPYEDERSDLGRLYSVWTNGYRDHSHLGTVSDAYVNYNCSPSANEDGEIDEGQCTSILWGYHELTLEPDERREKSGDQEGLMWSGYMSADEWEMVQLPGRIMASEDTFWESAVDDVVIQLLGYDLGTEVQEVRYELVKYLLENEADIRSVYYAIATSIPYLQSSQGALETDFRWSAGPLKQASPEIWIDSIKRTTGTQMGTCDHRISYPGDYLDGDDGNPANGWTFALVNNSRWVIDENRELVTDYRGIAQSLGGCPTNEIAGRFTTVSILNTAVQEAFIAEVCDPSMAGGGTDASLLLPEGMSSETALDSDNAQEVVARQTRLFFGREPTESEYEKAAGYADQCTPKPCTVERFARPVCFSLLSSAEMLFY